MKLERSIVLVIGGARSGKSRFALTRARELGPPYVFLATAEARDPEMAERIARHRAERGSEWATIEEPRRIAAEVRCQAEGVVVIDRLTLWLANLIGDEPEQRTDEDVAELAAALEARRSAIVVVTNEVGLGIVPENPLARAFRDAAGTMNRRVAELADEIHLLVAGQALRIK